MSAPGGHVFVVHGRVESVVHDFVLIPTDSHFNITGYWKPVLGATPERLKPRGWPGNGYARARGRRDVWFVNVGGRYSAGIDALLDRAAKALEEIASTGPRPGHNRKKPLVAVPVLGISGGGLGSERGEVVRRLLEVMRASAGNLDIDIAVVTPDASVYAAAQYLRRTDPSWPLPDRQLKAAMRLGHRAQDGELALFLGAGVSIPAGLPAWGQLLAALARTGGVALNDGFSKLSALDQAQYLSDAVPDLGAQVAEIVGERRVPALSHALLAALGCREAVTTNYDRLYEKAVRMQRGRNQVATVMPWEAPRAGRPWILKMHGDLKAPDSIVLTRQQFVSFDADTRPAGALLQALLMTRHVLFVGASLNDDNVIRLAYEVDRFRANYGLKARVGTLLDVEGDQVRRRLWRSKLSWLTMAGSDIQERSRTLEIFLDAVAAHASKDASWLLDDRFSALTSGSDALVSDAKDLYRRASAAGAQWEQLANVLAAFGAKTAEFDEEAESRRWRGRVPY